jgi:hypothetical protein
MSAHMSVFAPRTYKKAHRHGPGRAILIPGGEGYSVMWPEGSDIDMYVARTSQSVNGQTGSRLDPGVAVKNPSKTCLEAWSSSDCLAVVAPRGNAHCAIK